MNQYKRNVACSICGLPIPWMIVNRRHPLLGTIDHILPRSKGGKDIASNRAPAHLYCNSIKKSQEISDELRKKARDRVLAVFSTANDEVFAVLAKFRKQQKSGEHSLNEVIATRKRAALALTKAASADTEVGA